MSEWTSVRAQMREASYYAEPAKGGEAEKFTAANRRHGFSAAFGRDAVTISESQGKRSGGWNLSLKAARYGYGDDLKPVPEATEVRADGNKVEYLRGDMTEWYVNDARGVEQWFTLQKRPEPAGEGPLRIEMAVESDLTARLAEDGQSILFQDAAKKTTVKYHKLKVWDAEEKEMPARMEVKNGLVALIVDEKNAIYPIIIDPIFFSKTKLDRIYGDNDDKFGSSVALDENTIVIGAPGDEKIGLPDEIGVVYLFDSSLNCIKRLVAYDAGADDKFGSSVALDGSLVAVGAPYNDDDGENSGSVYIYDRSQGWAEIKLTASDAAAGDKFGFSVAVSGDLVFVGAPWTWNGGSVYVFDRSQGWAETKLPNSNGGGFGYSIAVNDFFVVVGAPSEDNLGNHISGAAYVYDRSQSWMETILYHGYPSNFFGASVAVKYGLVVVGAPENYNVMFDGSAYLFSGSQGWAEVGSLSAPDATSDRYFGEAVGILDNDTVVVGEPGDDHDGTDSGSVRAYEYFWEWAYDKKIAALDAGYGDRYGSSLATSGNTLVVGAPGDDDAGYNSGSAYFHGYYGFDVSQQKILASSAAQNDSFGWSVSISGDLIAIGAVDDDDGGTNSGSVYVYNGLREDPDAKLIATDAADDDGFGSSVAVSDNLLAVGAPDNDDNGENSGSVYVYDRAQEWVETKINASDAAAGDRFGYSISASGGLIVVGAPNDDDSTADSGSVYVYDRFQGWAETKITASDAAADDRFGSSISATGELLVAGTPYDDDGGEDSGSVYVYDRSQGWAETKLTASDAASGDKFGDSVAISSDLVVVGAPFDDDGGEDSGSVYIYDTSLGWAETKLTASDAAAGNMFGQSVAVSGDLVFVDNYIYDRSQGWSETKLSHDCSSVAVSGDFVVTGAPASSDVYVYEINVAPWVTSINRSPSFTNPTHTSTVEYIVTFSENVSGIDIDDFRLAKTGTTTGNISSVSAPSGEIVTVTINNIVGSGTLGLNLLDNNTIVDDENVPLGGGQDNSDFIGETYTIDRDSPTVTSITASTPTGTYKANDPITITVAFSEPVTLSNGNLNITLNTGDTLSIPPFTQSLAANATYIVGSGDATPALDATAISLSGGTLQDAVGNAANLAMPATTIADGKTLVIDGNAPGKPSISGLTPTFAATPAWTVESGGGGNGVFRYKLNDSDLLANAEANPNPPPFTVQPGTLSPGFHTLYAQERDEADNWSPVGMHTLQVVDAAPAVYGSPVPVSTTTPTWTWAGLAGLGGTGNFKYQLDGLPEQTTIATSFTPPQALAQGDHTLRLWERDAAGNWSGEGSFAITIDSPDSRIYIAPTTLEVREPEGAAEFFVQLAVRPMNDVTMEIYSSDTDIVKADPAVLTIAPDDWDKPAKITVADAPNNLINTQYGEIIVTHLVSPGDAYFDGAEGGIVGVTVKDDAAFTVYSARPGYGMAGEYQSVTILGSGFDPNTRVFCRLGDGPEVEPTIFLTSSNLIQLTVPDKNQSAPPRAGDKYTLRVTDGEKSFEEAVFFVNPADLEAVKRKKAILVAGGGSGYSGDYLWETTKYMADKAYDVLEFQGYSHESIRYLVADAADPQKDATLTNLETAITQWAAAPNEPGHEIDELFIYLTDHGLHESFTLNGREGVDLTAAALKSWLDELQNANPGIRVILVYDACLSGSFIPAVRADANAAFERILVTSSNAAEEAVFGDNGKLSFSDTFWDSAMNTGLLYRSFSNARDQMLGLGQHPQIEIPAKYGYANDIKIGLGLQTGASPIAIERICGEQSLACGNAPPSAKIWVSGIEAKNSSVKHVWAKIRTPEDDDAETPDTRLIEIPLRPEPDLDEFGSVRYSATFDGFSEDGQYYISVFASTINDKESDPVSTVVRQLCDAVSVKGDLNADEEVDLKDAILALQVLSGLAEVAVRPDYSEKPELDVNGDARVGLAEAVYALRESGQP